MSDDEVRYIAQALRKLEHLVSVLERHHNQFLPLDDVIRDLQDELLSRLEKIERSLALILSAQDISDPRLKSVSGELLPEMIENTIESLKVRLVQQYKNINKVKERASIYGTEPPLDISNQIDKIQKEIDRLENELDVFRNL